MSSKFPNKQHSKAIYGQRVCRIVKLWTNPFGIHSYQDVALRSQTQCETVGSLTSLTGQISYARRSPARDGRWRNEAAFVLVSSFSFSEVCITVHANDELRFTAWVTHFITMATFNMHLVNVHCLSLTHTFPDYTNGLFINTVSLCSAKEQL